MKKLLRYLVNTILYVLLWCIMFLPVMKYSMDSGSVSAPAIGGIVALIIAYIVIKRVNKSNLWLRLFDETEVKNEVVEEKKIEIKEEKIKKKVEVEEEKKQEGDVAESLTMQLLSKDTKILFASIFFIGVILFVYPYVNNKLKGKKYCSSEREAFFSMTYKEIPDDKKPDYSKSIHLKYSDGIVSYIAKISDDNYYPLESIYRAYGTPTTSQPEGKLEGRYHVSPDNLQDFKDDMALKGLTYEKEQPVKNDKDITKTYLYKSAGGYRSISMDVELLDKEDFLIKKFTINNFKLEKETVYPKGYYWHTEKSLIAKGSIEMSHNLFKKISCYERYCSDCGRSDREPHNIKLSVSY